MGKIHIKSPSLPSVTKQCGGWGTGRPSWPSIHHTNLESESKAHLQPPVTTPSPGLPFFLCLWFWPRLLFLHDWVISLGLMFPSTHISEFPSCISLSDTPLYVLPHFIYPISINTHSKCSFVGVVLTSLMSTWRKVESPEKRRPPLRKRLHKIGM